MARAYPVEIGPIREVRHTLSQLKLHDLAVGHDGRNRCLLSAFRARTGRNQPSNYGVHLWPLVLAAESHQARARVGRGLCGLESAGAGHCGRALPRPGDDGRLPVGRFLPDVRQDGRRRAPGGHEETHAAVREQFKVVSLGVLYGLSDQGIARRLGVPLCQGRLLLAPAQGGISHVLGLGRPGRDAGHAGRPLRTVFGWPVHVEAGANPRSLRNFPMQANGAEMLRLACCLATERGIRVCAPVHDALLVEARAEDIDAVVARPRPP